MSEETWNDFMSDCTTKKMLTFLDTTMNKGGLGVNGLEVLKRGKPDAKITP